MKDLIIWSAFVLLGFTTGCQTTPQERTEDNPVITQELINKAVYPDPGTRAELRAYQLGNVVFEKYIKRPEYDLDRKDPAWNLRVLGEYDPYRNRATGNASCWHYTTVLSLSNRLYGLSKEGNQGSYALKQSRVYNQLFTDLFHELSWYRGTDQVVGYNGTRDNVRLYAVDRAAHRDSASIARIAAVYDDQMWMIREFIDIYHYTGESYYLEHAEELTLYCLDGWDISIDPAMGQEWGGIPWGPGYSSKHTCSNAPLIKPLAELARIYKDRDPKKSEYYLTWADRVYQYSVKTFRNPNGVFGDALWYHREMQGEGAERKWVTLRLANPLDPTAYTYNTGAMISGSALLYGLTGKESYLNEAKSFADAAHHFFAVQYGQQYDNMLSYNTSNRIWFNLVLLTGYIDLYPYAPEVAAPYIATFEKGLDYAYDHYYFNGILPRNYIEGWDKNPGQHNPDTHKDVMESASNAEMYAMLAQYHKFIKR